MIRRIVLVFILLLAAAGCASADVPPVVDTIAPPVSSPTKALTRVPTASQTPRPSPTIAATPTGMVTADPNAPIEVTMDPRLVIDLEAPIRITVPDDWLFASDAMLLPEADGAFSAIPFSIYRGPVSGGTGTVMVLWAFPSIVPGVGGTQVINLFADGLRLLLFIVLEPECEYSYDEEQQFVIGGRPALGTYFAADQCPDGLPSMRGWFGALNVDGLNFAFYAFTEPLDAINGPALSEMQTILDSVEIDLSLLPTPQPTSDAPSATATP